MVHLLKVKWTIQSYWDEFLMWLADKLPVTLKKWVLVHAAIAVDDDNTYPGDQTYTQMYRALEKKNEG